jgi:CRP-like cAMP-binding protein
MEDLDFTSPAREPLFDPAVARACFESLGKPESVPEGQPFFTEDQASDRMYLLLEGEVRLIRGGKPLDVIKAGEIFGEMAVITGHRRTASAVARTACRALTLDARQFERAIEQKPEFALMLMDILVNRLRLAIALLEKSSRLPVQTQADNNRVFDKALVERLEGALHQRAPRTCPAGSSVMKEGEKGGFMYVVLSGKVTVALKSTVVARLGPGCVLGEMALLDQSPRAASAVAETDSSLLPINRGDFLSLVKSIPAFGVALLRALAQRLAQMNSRKT